MTHLKKRDVSRFELFFSVPSQDNHSFSPLAFYFRNCSSSSNVHVDSSLQYFLLTISQLLSESDLHQADSSFIDILLKFTSMYFPPTANSATSSTADSACDADDEPRFYPPLWQQRRNLARRILDENHSTSVGKAFNYLYAHCFLLPCIMYDHCFWPSVPYLTNFFFFKLGD